MVNIAPLNNFNQLLLISETFYVLFRTKLARFLFLFQCTNRLETCKAIVLFLLATGGLFVNFQDGRIVRSVVSTKAESNF